MTEWNLSGKYLYMLFEKDGGGTRRVKCYPQKYVAEFIRRLKEASKENDWEVAVGDGNPDGFIVIDGEQFIDSLAGEAFKEKKG